MKKGFIVALVALALAGCYRVDPGHVGIRVDLVGGDQGEMTMFEPGRHALGLQTRWYQFPVFTQNYVWTQDRTEGSDSDESFSFPIEGLEIGVDVGIEYSLEKDRVLDIFTTYRRGVDELTDVVIRNQVRNAFNSLASGLTMDQFISQGPNTLVAEVESAVAAHFAGDGIVIRSLSLVNAPRYPPTVQTAIAEKVEATQRAARRENELREAEAEAQKRIAEAEGRARSTLIQAQAEAEANVVRSASLTPQVLRARWLEAWDGSLPDVVGGEGELQLLLER